MNIKRVVWGPVLSFVFLIFFSVLVVVIQWSLTNPSTGLEKVAMGSVSTAVQEIIPIVAGDIEVDAKAAISVESFLYGPDKIIFEKNAQKQLPIASLTKLMTAIVVIDNYNLSDQVLVNKIADLQDPMKQDVQIGDIFPVESLLKIMLVASSNKAAYALAEGPGNNPGAEKFVRLMNAKAKDLGLEKTTFVDPTGLSDKNVSTASDLVLLAKYILKNYPEIAKITREKEMEIPNFGRIENTDQLLAEVPEIVCSKTGFTTAADGCLLLVINNQKNNDYIINVILGAGDRFTEMKKLIYNCQ